MHIRNDGDDTAVVPIFAFNPFTIEDGGKIFPTVEAVIHRAGRHNVDASGGCRAARSFEMGDHIGVAVVFDSLPDGDFDAV